MATEFCHNVTWKTFVAVSCSCSRIVLPPAGVPETAATWLPIVALKLRPAPQSAKNVLCLGR
jgi:hypothetical protein